MPNWCANTVELTHEDPAMIERVRSAFSRGELLNEFVPVPEDLKNTVAGSLGNGEEQKALEEQTERNRQLHGYSNWYDFCVNEWGTKWDVGGGDCDFGSPSDTHITLNFDSAWAPPIRVFERMVNEHGFNVQAYYYEPGMGFCGHYDGENDYDDYYEISGMSADEVEAALPEELDEMFGISENMRSWDEEEEAN